MVVCVETSILLRCNFVLFSQDKCFVLIGKEDNVQDKDAILQEHTDQGEHDVGENNCFPVQDSMQQHDTVCYIA